MEESFIYKYRKGYLYPFDICVYWGNIRTGILFLFLIFCSCTDNTFLSDKASDVASTITLILPGDVNVQSMTVSDENTVENLQVLAFREDVKSGDYYYAYTAEGRNLSLSGNQLTFEVSLYQYPQKQQFLFLANAQEALLNSNITVGMQIEDAITELIITNASEWQAGNKGVRDWETGLDASSNEVRYIPMYGRTGEIGAIPDLIDSYSLLRMLTRFDIVNKADNFKMVYACLFQWNDKGFLGYDISNWDTARETVISANVPAGATKTKEPVFYYSADSEGKRIESSIYSFEAAGTTERLQATALVVGGYYEGDESVLCWYRADIPEFDSNEKAIDGTYGDILRNNLYRFDITEVNGPGYPTPPEAYEGGVKIKANIKSWNLATQTIILDGQYRFETSHATIYYDKYQGSVTVEVSTDHPDGLTLGTVNGGGNWLTVSALSGTSQSATFQASVTENNSNGSRTATIPVKAGNLVYEIKVIQTDKSWARTGDNHQIYYKNGRSHTIHIEDIDLSTINWKVMDEDHDVLLKNWNMYEEDGGITFGFTMRDKDYDDLYDAAYLILEDKSTGSTKSYPIVSMENDEKEGPHNSLVVGVGDEIEIHSVFRKARAVWLHGDGVSGPLSETVLDESASKTIEIVWQDTQNVISELNLYNSTNQQTYFRLKGKTAGNAVIALKQNGVIVWSWHIWVVPQNNKPAQHSGWLDRNLGALQTTISDKNSTSMGLLYQWGRKDPFVTSSEYYRQKETHSNSAKPVYNANNTRLTDTQIQTSGSYYETVSVENNLANSIMNPFIFYGGLATTDNPGSSYNAWDWYCKNAYKVASTGNYEGQNHYLWYGKAGGKMPFDPCPEGYRIPQMEDWGVDDSIVLEDDRKNKAGINIGLNYGLYGVTHNNYGGNYHKSGMRYSNGIGFVNPGEVGYYWSATPGFHNKHEYKFHSRIIRANRDQGYFDVIQSFGRSHGMSVKCVRDVDYGPNQN